MSHPRMQYCGESWLPLLSPGSSDCLFQRATSGLDRNIPMASKPRCFLHSVVEVAEVGRHIFIGGSTAKRFRAALG